MTDIKYKVKDDQFHIECIGHANYSEYGRDIVCSAISALMQTLAFTVNADTLEIDTGRVVISGSGHDDRVRAEMAICGLKLIADAYPNNVKISALGIDENI